MLAARYTDDSGPARESVKGDVFIMAICGFLSPLSLTGLFALQLYTVKAKGCPKWAPEVAVCVGRRVVLYQWPPVAAVRAGYPWRLFVEVVCVDCFEEAARESRLC